MLASPSGLDRLPPRGRLVTHTLLLLAKLGRRRITEILDLEDLADFDFAVFSVRVGTALHPLDRLFARFNLPQPETRDQVIRQIERTVGHGPRAAGEAHAR